MENPIQFRLSILGRFRSSLPLYLAGSMAGLLGSGAVKAETFLPTSGSSSWNLPANWVEGTVPNGIGASAIFNSPTAVRTITLDSAITVGSLFLNISANFTNTISNGTGGSLVLDAAGTGPATITTDGTTTSLITLSATQTWNDSVIVNTISTTSTSLAGALTMTGAVSGTGGLTKDGNGTLTLASAGKTYTGPTLVQGGRLRLSVIGAPTMSSSVTVASGGQITFTGANGIFTLGTGALTLNGTGLAAFPGAIRADQVGSIITNPVVLESFSSINVPGSANSLTLQGAISGPGGLEVGTQPGESANQGILFLSGNNSYVGGTKVTQGTLSLGVPAAHLGAGTVTVDGVTLGTGGSKAGGKLDIQTGVLDAIDNFALLNLTGGGVAGTADGGSINLGDGVSEIVGRLMLGGVMQSTGTYGSSISNATFKNDEYFAGSGVVAVIPEPGAMGMLAGGLSALLGLGRIRRRG
ncbi:MAG: putative filamentous hemagglutinin-related protein [Chthoniobacteraceae bacterium]|nr:putative filamentous hemagglutinin-related protein [Chthoniobacteraceae bacterium]